ncbi:MAG: hypothetical protein OXC55_04175 [Chloroflexi bacterium]|nr:hypothetical protein [Chloroflexota bacterium]
MADVIAIVRDIVIIVWGVLGILVFLAIILVALSIFRALKPILENVRGTTGEVRTATRLVTDAIIRPAVPVISFYTGIRQGFRVLRRFGRRGQG